MLPYECRAHPRCRDYDHCTPQKLEHFVHHRTRHWRQDTARCWGARPCARWSGPWTRPRPGSASAAAWSRTEKYLLVIFPAEILLWSDLQCDGREAAHDALRTPDEDKLLAHREAVGTETHPWVPAAGWWCIRLVFQMESNDTQAAEINGYTIQSVSLT